MRKARCAKSISNVNDLSRTLRAQDGTDRPDLHERERFSDSLSQSRIPTLVAQMNGTLAELNRTLAKVNDGDGTVGKFVNDQALYDSLVQASSNLSALLLDLKQHPGRYVHFSVFGRRDRN